MPMSLKLKTKHSKSSTNAELFAIDDAMDFAEWIQLTIASLNSELNEAMAC